MTLKIRLTTEDQARYGGPEILEWDAAKWLTSEAEAFQEHIRDEQGNPVPVTSYQKWLQHGGVAVIKWTMWLALRRAGVAVDWAVFDPDFLGAGWIYDPEPEPVATPAGKARGRSTRQPRSGSAAKP